MKFQVFPILITIVPELLFASGKFGHGNEMILTWSLSALFSFAGLVFVIYGLFSKHDPKKNVKITEDILDIARQPNVSKKERNSELFGNKEKELFLSFADLIVKGDEFESITLYLLAKGELSPVYRKKGGIVIIPNEKFRLSNENEILAKLLNKEGVFNHDHTSIFLPLADTKTLFGAVEFAFGYQRKNFEPSEIWDKTKRFAKNFLRLHSYSFSQRDEETGLYNADFFWDILQMKSNEKIPDNLTLIRAFNINAIKNYSDSLYAEMIDLFGEDFKIFRLFDTTFGFFLTKIECEKFQNGLQEILSSLKMTDPEIHLSIGSADKNAEPIRSQSWFKKAENALTESIESGQNQFKQYLLK